LPDKKYSKAEFLGACVVFSDFNAIWTRIRRSKMDVE
jgi:hypothetical protein